MNRFQMWYTTQPRALRVLLSINVAIYVLWLVAIVHIDTASEFVYLHVALNPALPRIAFEPWQLLTYGFLHLGLGLNGMLHILFNMLWMVWIGRDYEDLYGPGRLLGIYVYGAVAGALFTVVLHALFPGVITFNGIVHGASGAVLAIITMVAIHHPERRIGLMFIGAVRLIHIVVGFIVLDVLFLSAGGTSVSAHLGGISVGYVSGRLARNGYDPTVWANVFFKGGIGLRIFRTNADRSHTESHQKFSSSSSGSSNQGLFGRMEGWLATRGGKPKSATIHQLYRNRDRAGASIFDEVDRILDKISETGYESLTEEERKTLLNEGDKGEA